MQKNLALVKMLPGLARIHENACFHDFCCSWIYQFNKYDCSGSFEFWFHIKHLGEGLNGLIRPKIRQFHYFNIYTILPTE